MIALAALALLQAAATPAPAAADAPTTANAPPRRFSILTSPCAAANDDKGKDIVVCGDPNALTPRLPLPQFRGPPDHPMPSNPDLSAAVALDGPSGRGECGAYGEGCPVGGGGYIAPIVMQGAIDLARSAFHKRHYKGKGVSIPLDDSVPLDTRSRLSP